MHAWHAIAAGCLAGCAVVTADAIIMALMHLLDELARGLPNGLRRTRPMSMS